MKVSNNSSGAYPLRTPRALDFKYSVKALLDAAALLDANDNSTRRKCPKVLRLNEGVDPCLKILVPSFLTNLKTLIF